jgi:Mn-dependent DtxR family transcriptional regulator
MTDRINDSSAWRAFEESGLTHSAAHYLTAILHLREQYGYARVTDVAEWLKISRGAASRAISMLKERGWIEEDPHRMLILTGSGEELARGIVHNYSIMESFLEGILGIKTEAAREDACKMEHLLSPETVQALFRLIRTLERNKSLMKTLKEKYTACEAVPDKQYTALPRRASRTITGQRHAELVAQKEGKM